MSPATLLPRERLGALWLWAALTMTACGGMPGQRLDALAHRGGQVGPREDEVERHDRDRRLAVVEHERLRHERVVDPLREARAGGPAAVRQAARAG